jgi:hypothetical protein
MSTPTLATAGGRTFAAGYAGQIADGEPVQQDSFVLSSATLDFGIVAVRDTSKERTCKAMSADGDEILGIVVRDPIVQPASSDGLNTITYKQYDEVGILRDCVIFVKAAEDVRAGDQALALTAGGAGNNQAGAIGGSKGGAAGSGRIDIPYAIWEDTTASGSIGRVRIKTVGVRRLTT